MKMIKDRIKVILHRGAHQIGGVCTEIAAGRTRLVFDLGMPMEGEGNQDKLRIEGVTYGNERCDGIFLTHYHGDHVGEVPDVLPGIPVYMGKAAKEILMAQQEHMRIPGSSQWAQNVISLQPEQSVDVGELRITPILSDHSAFQSFMYLVEGFGRRILLTGDFRLHGLFSDKLLNRLSKIGALDLLITEGTNITRDNGPRLDENWAADHSAAILRQYKYVFLLASSSNLERISEFSRAVPKGKYMLTDYYQKSLLKISDRYSEGPFQSQKVLTYGENLKDKAENRGFGMAVRANDYFKPIVKHYFTTYPKDSCLIYSMWQGYRDYPEIREFLANCRTIRTVHVSGHVTGEDLHKTVDILNPGKVVINHTSAAVDEKDDMKIMNLIHLEDEEVLEV